MRRDLISGITCDRKIYQKVPISVGWHSHMLCRTTRRFFSNFQPSQAGSQCTVLVHKFHRWTWTLQKVWCHNFTSLWNWRKLLHLRHCSLFTRLHYMLHKSSLCHMCECLCLEFECDLRNLLKALTFKLLSNLLRIQSRIIVHLKHLFCPRSDQWSWIFSYILKSQPPSSFDSFCFDIGQCKH